MPSKHLFNRPYFIVWFIVDKDFESPSINSLDHSSSVVRFARWEIFEYRYSLFIQADFESYQFKCYRQHSMKTSYKWIPFHTYIQYNQLEFTHSIKLNYLLKVRTRSYFIIINESNCVLIKFIWTEKKSESIKNGKSLNCIPVWNRVFCNTKFV